MATLARAIALAAQAHQEQRDKAGAPYILHPLRMMFQMNTEVEKIVAVLHDVVEDTPWTPQQLREEGFSEEVLTALDGVTARAGESYEAFIERARSNPIARRVKLADLQDNMDTRRMTSLSDRDIERLRKYHHYYHLLREDTSSGA
jgi:(p)ppGpp synthase/HD superfamily hydrolase